MTAKPWTRKEEWRAAKMRRCGCPAWVIARVLGRGVPTVSVRLWEMGVRVKRRKGELSAAVARMHAAGLFDWEVADDLGVSVNTVKEARRRLRLAGNEYPKRARPGRKAGAA